MATVSPMPSQLSIIPSGPGSDKAFDKWQGSLLKESEEISNRTYWLPRHRIIWQLWGDGDKPDTRFDYHGTNRGWTVEINRPTSTGSNRTSAIAVEPQGGVWLIRQGWLQANRETPKLIKGADFIKGTGLRPVPTKIWKGPLGREWFPVTCIDQPPDVMVDQTYHFISRCASARARYNNEIPHADAEILDLLFAQEEYGGYNEMPGRDAMPPGKAFRLQGEVWQALKVALSAYKIELLKPKHGSGYTVDGSFSNGKESFLIEIKTDNSANSLYTGVGQLLLYSRLIPSLSNHTAVLMLPELPNPALAKVVASIGIEIITYKCNSKIKPREVILEKGILDRFL